MVNFCKCDFELEEIDFGNQCVHIIAKEAVQTAVSYVAAALDNSIGAIGSGPGPLNHFHNVVAKPYAGYIYGAHENLF